LSPRPRAGDDDERFAAARERMVERQLAARGIRDERVLAAMAAVPRERFVEGRWRRRAYDDGALPIGHGQTISQPWVVAAICQGLGLGGSERVLEVGTGSGYSAAVLSLLAGEVVSVERVPELARGAAERLRALGYPNVEVIAGDASAGLAGRGPFEGIAVHASAPALPAGLVSQLAGGGRLVIPIAERGADLLTVFRRAEIGDELTSEVIGPCRFVPLIGREGFAPGGDGWSLEDGRL
jgi:protein-L-isoaspartate(D-aspartate) O-methyltransferase